jgi:hypothetical protein
LAEGIFPKEAMKIFDTKSPVEFGQKSKPRKLSKKVAATGLASLNELISPTLEVRKEMNEVYGSGYFENHYPDADKELKDNLHNKAMVAHSNMQSKEREGKATPLIKEAPSILIVVNNG